MRLLNRALRGFCRAAPWLSVAVVLGLVVRRGWIGDDAVITVRVVDNFLHGYGLRWNVAERVQVFTHPLWAILLILLMAMGLHWYTALAAMALSATSAALCGVALLSQRRAALGVTVISVLGYSRAFLDYSTSGLENPLAVCAILLLLSVVPVVGVSLRDVRRVSLVVALLALTRFDLILLALPVWAYALHCAARAGARAGMLARAAISGLLPLLVWEVFSTVYYGFPFPNTAYAKLNTGIDRLTLLRLGADYYRYTLVHDPWTLVAALLALSGVFMFGAGSAAFPLVAGALAYYAYILWIGGDFMGGRFFVAPLVLLVGMLASGHVSVSRRVETFLLAGALLVGMLFWMLPILAKPAANTYGPLDERSTYVKATGLQHVWRAGGVDHSWLRRGAQWRMEANEHAHQGDTSPLLYRHAAAVGMLGLAAGPKVHIIDHLALTDALLARLPAAYDPRIQPGHFERMGQWSSKKPVLTQCPLEYEVCRFWRDYELTLRTGRCMVEDPNLCEYWRALHTVTHGPLWSTQRWLAMVRLNLGLLDDRIDVRRYREASLEYPGEGSGVNRPRLDGQPTTR